jgi:maleate isomerase
MSERIRMGMLTPSSNTVLEPVTQAIVGRLPAVSVHFSRFTVTESSLSPKALSQFDHGPMLKAAELLAHAKVDVIGWSGTSAAWLGFDNDIRLCEEITAMTGIPATTSMLAINQILARTGVKSIGLVSPYPAEVVARIVENYVQLGVSCKSERHLGIRDNFAIANITDETITKMIREVAVTKPDAVLTICTNMNSAPVVAELEAELGLPIYDSIASAVWSCLGIAGVSAASLTDWGRMFQLPAGYGA